MVYLICLRRKQGFKSPVPNSYIYITHAKNEGEVKAELHRTGWTYCFKIYSIATLTFWEFLAAAILPIEMQRSQMGWFKNDKRKNRGKRIWG